MPGRFTLGGVRLFLLFFTLAGCKTTAPRYLMKTDAGDITFRVYVKKAPIAAANFVRYLDEKRLDGATFYRVVRLDNQPQSPVKIEVIQGGLDSTFRDRRLPAIAHETTAQTGILHKDGTLSMGRTQPGTASSEFFICINDQPELDFGGKRNPDGQGFSAFGQVLTGMDVVRRIQAGETDEQALKKLIVIQSIVLLR